MTSKILFIFSFLLASVFSFSQEFQIVDKLPSDLQTEKIIFLKHEPIEVNPKSKGEKKQDKYVRRRQENHNQVIEEANQELVVAAMEYPYGYAVSTNTAYMPLIDAGYKYVLDSRVYDNKHLEGQPNEDELIVFEYYLVDIQNQIAFYAFKMDEMKVYDSKMLVRRLLRAIRKDERYELN